MSQYTKQPANADEVSVDEYYDMIDESLNASPESRQWPHYAIDFVAGPKEWANFKAAMERWMAEQDRSHAEGHAQYEAEERESRELRSRKVVPLREV